MVQNHQNKCSLLRRFLAISYDLLLLSSCLFVATLIILPITGGEAIYHGNLLYTGYLLFFTYLYFIWQWVHGGQTLGMQAWHLQLRSLDGENVSWIYANKRFLFAILSWLAVGLGFLWAFLDHEHLTFHDRYSNTNLIKMPKLS